MSFETLAQLRAGKLAGATRLDLSCELTEFPREIFELADSLEILNLSQNRLSNLPEDLSRLRKMRILFCSDNLFTHVPACIGKCESLTMVGFKANQIETVDEDAFSEKLRWLILTDNRLKEVPGTLGRCRELQKLMLSGNQLSSLPETMAECDNLELVRLAANRFDVLPEWLLKLPKLAWLAIAGNPMTVEPGHVDTTIPGIGWDEIEMGEKLGEGASGVIWKAKWVRGGEVADTEKKAVAVKLFRGAMTSDGLPASEMAACVAAGLHPNLVPVLGRIVGHSQGTMGLVMELIDPAFKNLAGPPSFESCTRDVYPQGVKFTLEAVKRMALGIASATAQLHERGILHGDLYAHNVLWREDGESLLSDFGAAAFYRGGEALQRIEVRAFGYLLEELLTRCHEAGESKGHPLWSLQRHCTARVVGDRPLFWEIVAVIEAIA